MAQTTHTTSAALNGCASTACPTWCAGTHPGPDPNHAGYVSHRWGPLEVETLDGAAFIELARFDDDEHGIGTPTIVISCDDDTLLLDSTQTLQLASELLNVVNQALPPALQTFLLPPGVEYVEHDCDWI